VFFGTYATRNGILSTEERRALVDAGGGTIHYDVPYGQDISGTYEILANGHLKLTIDGSVSEYQPS
jgi:hypothetical protein